MSAPEWLSKQLFQEALRKYFQNENIKVLEFTNVPALAVGENYASEIFRTSITFTTDEQGNKDTLSVIVKCFPQAGLMVDIVKEMALFETEIIVYSKIFPAIYKLLGNSENISPKCIYSAISPHKVLIFEDLSALNFKTPPRQEGLNLEHCLLVVEKLACFHATSMVLCEQDLSIITNNFTNGLYRDNEFTKKWISTGFNALSETCAKWPGFEKYATKLKAIQNKAVEKVLNAAKPKAAGINVLNHGDAWTNNFMFLYTPDGNLKELRFLDLQLVFYSSPAVDLHYFWGSSPNIDVKIHHLDTVLDHYYTSFVKTLARIKYPQEKVPTRAQLREEFDSRAFYGLTTAIICLPVVVAENRKDASLDEFLENDSKDGYRHYAYHNESYKKHVEHFLPYFDRLGLLD